MAISIYSIFIKQVKIMSNAKDKTTHFGYEQVAVTDKAKKVEAVFSSVASSYDTMNDVMSFGLHRLWKKFTIEQAKIKPGQKILDLASGTGDLAKAFSKRVGNSGLVVMSDINQDMLNQGRAKLLDQGIYKNLEFTLVDAEQIPFTDNHFDLVTIAFGLRNVTDKNQALREMYRVLKPGGKAMILEFSKPPVKALAKIYDVYSFKVIPKMGKTIANDEASYQYLVESIRMHPDQETVKNMLASAGFEDCEYRNLTGGIVALHWGFKY
jgi:demethylmenaquinone methyltransferase/2-methoxy-6-polyprenyl-1,4-benzoquinol methylase